MNRKSKYFGDSRYEKVFEQMKLLGIQDVSTKRQEKNGTTVWKLPIKNNYYRSKPSYIEVASFSTGYVRNQNSGYSNYQLNKRCESDPQYYPVYEWCDEKNANVKTDKFRQFTTRSCVLIPIEIDRLEYLLKYCVKNYYIKNANQVPNGEFYPKWMYDRAIDERDSQGWRDKVKFLQSDVDEHANTVIKLEEKLFDITEKYNSYKKEYKNRASEVNDLQNKLNTIKRIASYE